MGSKGIQSNRIGSAQVSGWRDQKPRGFVRLWQFRSKLDPAPEPAQQGPHWRDPALATLEAVLFVGREPLTSRKIAQLASLADTGEARTLIRRLNRLYDAAGSAFRVEEVAGGYQLLTRTEFGPWLRRMLQSPVETRLSTPAMETLAVVAYRQPVLRAEIEAIRGVQCGDILRQLMERDLVRIAGRSEDLGRPLLYGTTKRFLELFGLRHLDELPRAAELRSAESGENTTDDSTGAGRNHKLPVDQRNPEEESVTTRIRPARDHDELSESPAALAEAAREDLVRPLSAAKEEEEADEDEWDDDDDDEDDDEDEDEEEDDFVDEEWKEVDDEEADEDDDEEDDDEEWDDDEDDDWDDDDDEEEEEEAAGEE